MATKRMFSIAVTERDSFLDMPTSSQALYFHLGMNGDDDGFVDCPRKILRGAGCNDDDLRVLVSKGFVIPFDSGVVVIRDWNINNTLKNDRYHETVYLDEKAKLCMDAAGRYVIGSSLEPDRNQGGSSLEPEHNITEHNKDSSRPNSAGAEPDGVKKAGKGKQTPRGYSPDSNPYRAAAYLAERRAENFPQMKPPTEKHLQSWADAFRLLNERDGYPWELIQDVLIFTMDDPFWRRNILSGDKFRKQFETLLAKMDGEAPA